MKKTFLFILMFCLLLPGCIAEKNNDVYTKEEKIPPPPAKEDLLLSEMTLDEKIYQMMFTTPEAVTGVGQVVAAGEATKTALSEHPVGGLVYFSQNFENPSQTKEMIENTQSFSEIPLFISVDEEGGIVSRLGSNSAMGIKKQPPMAEIGKSGITEKAYTVGKELSEALIPLGFNMDFAPVADVLINKNNSEIGNRSFGSDASLVAGMVEKTVAGMEENGLSATLKHFPGHGSTYNNSHNGRSESERTLDELRQEEFLPFKAGISAGVDFIMVSHMTLVNATEEKAPSSVSQEVITDMLKGELGYKGIIITDAFNMGAIVNEYKAGEAEVKAIKAGADMILMPRDLKIAVNALKAAVAAGEITEERINESVLKILKLKSEKGLI